MKKNRFTVPWVLIFASTSQWSGVEAFGQSSISFANYMVPRSGSIALVVRQNAPLEGAYAAADAVLNGGLQWAVSAAKFRGESGKRLHLVGLAPFDHILLIGIGSADPDPLIMEEVGGHIGNFAAERAGSRIEVLWPGNEPEAGPHLALGAALGEYRFTKYRESGAASRSTEKSELVIRTPLGAEAGPVYENQWRPVVTAVRFARDLSTEPANVIYPESFIERTREAFKGITDVQIETLDVPAMQKLGMGGMLSVGQGSSRPPRLLVVRYTGGDIGAAPLAFVGKGITFDSGGISIKDEDGMWRMKSDMSGAAAVTGAVLALAMRRAPVNAVAIAALAENMPSGTAARPGDVVRTMSGKTFEIMSTDAEGRMVLTDAIWYAQQRFEPRALIDLATLTGAIRTALGDDYAGLFSRDDQLADQLLEAGRQAGEPLWRMPMHTSYAEDLESPIADVRAGGTQGPGAGNGAHFIGAWIQEGTPWAHLDIAGMSWRTDNPLPTSPKGASGYGVRLLDRFVRINFEPAR